MEKLDIFPTSDDILISDDLRLFGSAFLLATHTGNLHEAYILVSEIADILHQPPPIGVRRERMEAVRAYALSLKDYLKSKLEPSTPPTG